jgi:hypothetical protein
MDALMNRIRRFAQMLVTAMLLAFGGGIAFAQTVEQAELAKALDGQHPRMLMLKAEELFGKGDTANAAFLFYLSQLRWSVERLARPDAPVGDQTQSFDALNLKIGKPINGIMLADMASLSATLNAVRAHEAAHPDTFTPKVQFGDIWDKQLGQFTEFLRYTESEAKTQEIRKRAEKERQGQKEQEEQKEQPKQ